MSSMYFRIRYRYVASLWLSFYGQVTHNGSKPVVTKCFEPTALLHNIIYNTRKMNFLIIKAGTKEDQGWELITNTNYTKRQW